MQKWTLLAPLLLFPATHYALAENSALPEADNNLEIPAVAPEQDHIASMMEDNFYFETEHRKLVNALALEELRSKLSKLQNTSIEGEETNSSRSGMTERPREPKVLLVANIAGASRVAVSVGKRVKMVRLNEIFQANGKAYRLFNGAQNGVVTIKEVTP